MDPSQKSNESRRQFVIHLSDEGVLNQLAPLLGLPVLKTKSLSNPVNRIQMHIQGFIFFIISDLLSNIIKVIQQTIKKGT